MTGSVHAVLRAESGTVEVLPAADQMRSRPDPSDPAHAWLCVACASSVASEKDRHLHEGRSEFSFKNPEGVRFSILTFSRTRGCREVGLPTLEHTWFPQHAWSFCVCARCQMHLGWFYTGPTEFAALIVGRIVRAAVLGN